ncbi:MAG: hypothetical protein ACR2PA_09610 [Hyphomicrobiaceae bacterium]
MSQPKFGLVQYSNGLRHVLSHATSDGAAHAARSQVFRASLVENPLRDQHSIAKAIESARYRES